MNARTTVEHAARSRLEIGEPLLASGFAWIAFPRPQVSLLVLARRPHLVGLTDRRFLIWARPRARASDSPSLVLDEPLTGVTLEHVRTFAPMLALRIETGEGRQLVLEFRPRDRRLGHRIAREMGAPTPPPAPSDSEVPAAPS